MWRAAVDALETALKHDPKLVLPRANLGLAYLVHPDGKKPDQALEHFRKVDLTKDKGLDNTEGKSGLSLSAFLVNYGVAEMAKGNQREARDRFLAAQKVLATGSPLLDQLDTAIVYNLAMLDAQSGGKDNQVKAFFGFERYLAKSTSASTWWNVAFERYEKLGKDTETPSKTREVLVDAYSKNVVKILPDLLLRTLTTIDLPGGGQLSLADSAAKTLKSLDKEKMAGIPIYPNSIVKRYAEGLARESVSWPTTTCWPSSSPIRKLPVVFVQPRHGRQEERTARRHEDWRLRRGLEGRPPDLEHLH